MKRTAGRPVVLAAVLLFALAVGGGVGWWLAVRAMPMAGMQSKGSADMTDAEEREGMDGDSGTPSTQGRAGMPETGGTVRVDPVRLQRIGVRYAVALKEPLGRTIRAEASVAYDEERRAFVTTKIAGWVERLYVDKPAQPVRRGEPLLEIYSPELVSTQRELVLALERVDAEGSRPRSGVTSSGAMPDRLEDPLSSGSLVESARRRLELWDVPSVEIERLERTREARRTLTLAAPVTGVVVEKDVLQGAHVEPGENLYQIADLSTVWVEARVFEMDLADIQVGQPATITLKAYPNETFSGKITFLYPYLDPATRTVKVRLEVPNPAGRLKPGMFAVVSFDVSAGRETVVVPASAVIETGERAFVLVKRGEGLFEPRDVEVGARAGERIAIMKGLVVGETVVASANFLIDSEANLTAYMGGMLGMGMRGDQMRMDAQGGGDMQNMPGAPGMPGREAGQR